MWAQAVQWAVKNQHRKKLDPKKVSALKYSIWEYGREFRRDLNVHMMNKAIAILEKCDAAGMQTDADLEEIKGVQDIDEFLTVAIKASGE